jgi:hypothetical protein
MMLLVIATQRTFILDQPSGYTVDLAVVSGCHSDRQSPAFCTVALSETKQPRRFWLMRVKLIPLWPTFASYTPKTTRIYVIINIMLDVALNYTAISTTGIYYYKDKPEPDSYEMKTMLAL